jgi:hypothetical protein
MKPLKNALHLLCAVALAASMGCQSDSPTEPSSGGTPATPKPPTPVTTYTINVTPSPGSLVAGSGTPSTVTVDVRRSDTGQPPADLTEVTLTTTLGEFGAAGSGATTTTVQLVNGRAQVALFPGTNIGTATIKATLGTSAGAANVQIGQAGTFFISSVNPSVGSPSGGEEVTILGGGFDGPVRVTFNGAAGTVRSVTPTQIRVQVPPAAASGTTVPVGQSVPVSVSVTINYNETGTATDTLPGGFAYSLGGQPQQPAVLSVSPISGTNDGGTRVTIIGEGFQAPVQVLFGQGTSSGNFNGVEASVVETTATRIVVIAPPARGFGQDNVNQLVNILVKNLNTGFSTVASSAFKYGNKVIITAMGPGSGSYLGGDRVVLHGQGFDEPATVCLGTNPCIAQQVISVTGTEIVFITSGVPVTQCPANGVISVTGVSVTNVETGDSGSADIGFNYTVPLPVIFGLTPTGGSIGSQTTINGRNFGSNVQVVFGDPANGSSASIVSLSGSSIRVVVPTPPSGFVFSTEACDGPDADNLPNGTRFIATPISVTVRNLDGTGCLVTLTNAYTLNPPNNTCSGEPAATTPECADGIDNDLDGKTDFGTDPLVNDPQCTSATDASESS